MPSSNFGYTVEYSGVSSTTASKTSVATVEGAATLTAAQVMGGMVLHDPAGGAANATLPSASLLAAALGVVVVAGHSVRNVHRNTADAAETITVVAGAGGAISGTATIAQNNSKEFLIVFSGPAAYTAYSLGTVVH